MTYTTRFYSHLRELLCRVYILEAALKHATDAYHDKTPTVPDDLPTSTLLSNLSAFPAAKSGGD